MKKLLLCLAIMFLFLAGCATSAPSEVPTTAPSGVQNPTVIPTEHTPMPEPEPQLSPLSPEYVKAYAKALATQDAVKVPEEYQIDEEIAGTRMIDGHALFYTVNGCNVYLDGTKTDTILYECVWVEGLDELPTSLEELQKAYEGSNEFASAAEGLYTVNAMAEISRQRGDFSGIDKVQLYRLADEIAVVYRYFAKDGEDVVLSGLYIDDQPAVDFYNN